MNWHYHSCKLFACNALSFLRNQCHFCCGILEKLLLPIWWVWMLSYNVRSTDLNFIHLISMKEKENNAIFWEQSEPMYLGDKYILFMNHLMYLQKNSEYRRQLTATHAVVKVETRVCGPQQSTIIWELVLEFNELVLSVLLS